MAKRKRLSPAVGLGTTATPTAAPTTTPGATSDGAPVTRAPIASVAGEAATAAAFDAVAAELSDAKTSGRMVMQLPLEAIDPAYLIRDRLVMEAEDMDALMDSLRRRGQQSPIEVVDLGEGRYGLISGARRLKALERLLRETGEDRYGTVQALVRQPEDQVATYVAMIEENEIRADLSFYERARIAHKSVEAGVFATQKSALQSLFAGISFSKRSKIKSFIVLVEALDDVLRFPAQLTERQGLALVKAISEDARAAAQVRVVLEQTDAATPAQEEMVIASFLKPPAAQPPAQPSAKSEPKQVEIARGIRMEARAGRVVLEGEGVTEAFIARLTAVLSPKR